jgi:hypothetical protein
MNTPRLSIHSSLVGTASSLPLGHVDRATGASVYMHLLEPLFSVLLSEAVSWGWGRQIEGDIMDNEVPCPSFLSSQDRVSEACTPSLKATQVGELQMVLRIPASIEFRGLASPPSLPSSSVFQ